MEKITNEFHIQITRDKHALPIGEDGVKIAISEWLKQHHSPYYDYKITVFKES